METRHLSLKACYIEAGRPNYDGMSQDVPLRVESMADCETRTSVSKRCVSSDFFVILRWEHLRTRHLYLIVVYLASFFVVLGCAVVWDAACACEDAAARVTVCPF